MTENSYEESMQSGVRAFVLADIERQERRKIAEQAAAQAAEAHASRSVRERPDPAVGAAAMLEDQLAESTHLVRDLTDFIMHHSDHSLDLRFDAVRHVSSLMEHSATVAKVVARLKGVANQSRHISVIERRGEEGGGGGGCLRIE